MLTLSGCARFETPKPTLAPVRLKLQSDAASLPLARKLADAYMTANPNATIILEWGSATSVADATLTARADIALTTVLPAMQNRTVWYSDVAQDGVAVIVHSQNPLQNLSLFELREVYAGARSRWSDVGIAALGDIDLAMREDGETGRALFENAVMNGVKLSLNGIVLPTTEVMLNFVALRPGAIGYAPASRVTATVKPISIENQAPSRQNISGGTYPLRYSTYLMSLGEPQGEARKFALWALGADAQRIVEASGYIAISR